MIVRQKAESERALHQKERSIQEQEEAFKAAVQTSEPNSHRSQAANGCWQDELETLRQEANKAESKLKRKAEEDILRKEQAHQAGI